MKHIDMTNVQEAGEFDRLPAGSYVCVIRDVEDFPQKEYLKVTYDIAAGKYAGYYDKTKDKDADFVFSFKPYR